MIKRVLAGVAACAALVSLSAGPALAGEVTGSGSNSANVKLCQNGGWQTLFRADGTGFKSYHDCVSYGARGGTILTSPPASQSQADCEQAGGQSSRAAPVRVRAACVLVLLTWAPGATHPSSEQEAPSS
jgi:hypothetical protein